MRELLEGGTSDIARAVRNALRSLARKSGAKALTLVSDGAQSGDQLELARRIAAGDPASELGDELGELLGSASGVDLLQVVGLGRLPKRVNQSARAHGRARGDLDGGMRAGRRDKLRDDDGAVRERP